MSKQKEQELEITHKYKFGANWKLESVQSWMRARAEEFDEEFNEVKEDYKEYRAENFAATEEYILNNIVGVSEDLAEKAHNASSLLRYYSNVQREQAMRIRKKIEEVSGSETIQMQIIPIAVRMIDDNETDGGKIFVFRVRDEDGDYQFVDCDARVYCDWFDYLENNKLPRCIMCYPKDGLLRLKREGTDQYVQNTVAFCDSISCSPEEVVGEKFATVMKYATPLVAVAYIAWPQSRKDLGKLLGILSSGFFCSNLAMQGYSLLDQRKHHEDIGASLRSFITSITNIVVSNGLSSYLHNVAVARRSLTAIESVVITGVLIGLRTAQVVSFVNMITMLAMKPLIEPMDIVSFVVSCHNLYSCVISPKTAGQLLRKVKAEIQAELKQAMDKDQGKKVEVNKQIEENRQKLDKTNVSNDQTKIRQEMLQDNDKIQKLDDNILQNQNEYLDNVKGWMEHEGAQEEFDKFVVDAMDNRGIKTEIEQNDLVINVVTYMDAEKIFTAVSDTGSKIQFANGETLDLLINSTLEIHPRAISRLSEYSGSKDYVKNMMEITRDYAENNLSEEDFLQELKLRLDNYNMFTNAHITKIPLRNTSIGKHAPDWCWKIAYKLAKKTGDISMKDIGLHAAVVWWSFQESRSSKSGRLRRKSQQKSTCGMPPAQRSQPPAPIDIHFEQDQDGQDDVCDPLGSDNLCQEKQESDDDLDDMYSPESSEDSDQYEDGETNEPYNEINAMSNPEFDDGPNAIEKAELIRDHGSNMEKYLAQYNNRVIYDDGRSLTDAPESNYASALGRSNDE